MAIKMPNRAAKSMEKAINSLVGRLPAGAFKTATVDRGKEFSCYSKLNIQVYFADPYSSWQRGSNENANGLHGARDLVLLVAFLVLSNGVAIMITTS